MKKNGTAAEDFKSLQNKADISSMFGKQEFFNPYVYYFQLYKKLPHRHWFKEINKPKLMELLSKDFNLNEAAVFQTHIHQGGDEQSSPGVGAYILSNEFLLCFPPWEFGNTNDAQLYFSDEVPKHEVEKAIALIKECFTLKSNQKKRCFFIDAE